MHDSSHQHTLARGPLALVQRCECCGQVHLHVGPVSLRLDPSAAASVSETLGEAMRVLELELLGERATARLRCRTSA